MNEAIKEKLSALADGELSDFEVRRVLDEIERNPEYRNYWSNIQKTKLYFSDDFLNNSEGDISEKLDDSINKFDLKNKIDPRENLGGEKTNYFYYSGAACAGLLLVFLFNLQFFSPNALILEDSYAQSASEQISNSIASPQAIELLKKSVVGMNADLKSLNSNPNGLLQAQYRLSENGKTFRVSMSPLKGSYQLPPKPLSKRVYIKTGSGIFVLTVSGNITDAKKIQILQNANLLNANTLELNE